MRFMKILSLFLLVLYSNALLHHLENTKSYRTLYEVVWESEQFRAMQLGEAFSEQTTIDFEELAAAMMEHDFDLTKMRSAQFSLRFPMKNQEVFLKLADQYRKLFQDLKCFPIPKSIMSPSPDIKYEDGWKKERTYGGDREHEGCDLMAEYKASGYYPVLSITDGRIEKAGWSSLGGRYIGIRSPGGTYFYYAHLEKYSEEWIEGTQIKAGELIGFVGDTGYGEEGTKGQFPPHLHIGIYLRTSRNQECSINPYWILRYLEQFRTMAVY